MGSQEERKLITEADEFKALLRGLGSLRRLNWRFGLSAEVFLPQPDAAGNYDLAEAGEEAASLLGKLHAGTSSRLGENKAAWHSVEALLSALKLELGQWDPDECFEAGGDGAAAERQRGAPLCVLCMLPAAPLGLGAPSDCNVASALWKKGVWHVQCANFWIRHGATSSCLKELGISDP